MRNRKPYEIRKTMLIYNGLQVIINSGLLTYVRLIYSLDKEFVGI